MRRLAVLAVASMMATLAICTFSGVLSAQTNPEAPPVYDACKKDKAKIVAGDLPKDAQDSPGERDIDLDRCPVEDRPIQDGMVGAVLPEPGRGTSADILTTAGSQDLMVLRPGDGSLELTQVGNEMSAEAAPSVDEGSALFQPSATATDDCGPGDYLWGYNKWFSALPWRFNSSTNPTASAARVLEDLRQGGTNITGSRNPCGIADQVDFTIDYKGDTSRLADITSSAYCGPYDGVSVVSFGDLSQVANGATTTLAYACNDVVPGNPNFTTESDIKFNKREGVDWTAELTNDCVNRYSVEAVMTHERGHSFGLLHVSEAEHPYHTMSPTINEPCSNLESSLARGDVKGLIAISRFEQIP